MDIDLNKDMVSLDKCPHCGNDNEYYVKITMSGKGRFHYTFEGDAPGDNENLHDKYLTYKEQKTMYCSECDKKVGIKP